MRVTFVSYDDDPPLGGQGVVLHGMRETLTARGVEVSTVSGRGEHAIRYPRATRRAPLDLSLWLNRNPRLLTAADPDLVHAQGGPGGVLLLRRPTVPLVYTAHHTYSQAYGRTQPRRALSALEAVAYRHAARVLAVSASTADALRRMRIDANRIEVVPPGVSVAPLEPSLREPGRMLFVGRLEAEKGAVPAVTVMRAISRARPGSSAAVIGGGGQSARVRGAAQGAPSIELLGHVDEATLRRELARASVVLMPSRYEGLGLVALEAQERGTPVVGYDVTGLRDAVHGGGLLVPRDDVDALRRACLRVLDDSTLAAELSERGRAFVQREHSWEVVGARLLEAYQAVLGASGRLTGAAAQP